MSEKSVDLNLLLAGISQSILERTLVAEYLLSKGYLTSDVEVLPPQVAKSLMGEAYRFAARRLAEFEFIDSFQFRLPVCLN
jgi:hypothetical protein